MRLELKNIGKLAEANIELNGISVIAGENNSGKSTVGKVLFSVFNSFYNFENQIKNSRINILAQIIKKEFFDHYDNWSIDALEIAKQLYETDERNVTKDYICDILKDNVEEIDDVWGDIETEDEDNTHTDLNFTNDFLQLIINNYKRYFIEISEGTIYANIYNRQIRTMFHSQLNNFNVKENGYIILNVKKDIARLDIEDNFVKEVTNTLSLETEALYLDNPFILDEWMLYATTRNTFFNSNVKYRTKLLKKLMVDNADDNVENVFKEVINSEKLNNILSKIGVACDGTLSFNNKEGFSYRCGDIQQNININNISTGLKTFLIIKTLLINGSLCENGTIILDEPEIHLHPEWQLLFAEIIVLLQKEYNLHILLTTHSPYFLRALEVYSAKYSVANKCKYYLSENIGHISTIKDVTTHTDEIYKKLAMPLEILQSMRFEND